MRSTFSALLLVFIACVSAFSQSNGFEILRNKFQGKNDVFCISTSGLLARCALLVSGEHDFKKAIKDIDAIRLITIPKSAFHDEQVSVKGFKNILAKADYEQLTSVRDHDDDVTLYVQSGKNNNNMYLLLVDSRDDVVAIEIEGYIDPQIMLRESNRSLETNHKL
jgi:hypothetical protein